MHLELPRELIIPCSRTWEVTSAVAADFLPAFSPTDSLSSSVLGETVHVWFSVKRLVRSHCWHLAADRPLVAALAPAAGSLRLRGLADARRAAARLQVLTCTLSVPFSRHFHASAGFCFFFTPGLASAAVQPGLHPAEAAT